MSVISDYNYDYVFDLASRLSPEERNRLLRELAGNMPPKSEEYLESFLPDADEVPYSPEEFYEFLLHGPVIDEEHIRLMLDAEEEVNRCHPISW